MKRISLALVLLAGCGGGERQYLDLHKGAKWTYVVSMDGDESIEVIAVIERAPVGPYSGWLLDSAMGRSRLAWHSGGLYASELAGSVFSPPVPLFSKREAAWAGTVTTPAGTLAGKANLAVSKENLLLGGKSYSTVKTILTLSSGAEKTELTTWFYPDLGILRQEQRSGPNMLRNRRIEFVSSK